MTNSQSSNIRRKTIIRAREVGDTTIVFSLSDKIGGLAEGLKLFSDNKINLKHIESRSSKRIAGNYEFLVKVDGSYDVSNVVKRLMSQASYFEVIRRDSKANEPSTPWFPVRIRDLDLVSDNILLSSTELEADHPGFSDPEYRSRRKYFSEVAKLYRYGSPIPEVDYTQSEIDTWTTVYDKVIVLYEKYACKEFTNSFRIMETSCGYSRYNIPQLEDVSNFLKDSTGFTLRPIAGTLSSRDFLSGLAHRVSYSVQYIRHHTSPGFTLEPDICHELLGHAPLLADPEFARFSQEIGMASLGVSDEYIERLATCYWFTVEFGLCKQDDQIKAYGASLLSSFSELEYSMSDQPKILPFDPMATGLQKYPVTEFQPIYFVAESFADARRKVHEFAKSVPRESTYRYNPYTRSIETLESTPQVLGLVNDVKNDITLVVDGLDNQA